MLPGDAKSLSRRQFLGSFCPRTEVGITDKPWYWKCGYLLRDRCVLLIWAGGGHFKDKKKNKSQQRRLYLIQAKDDGDWCLHTHWHPKIICYCYTCYCYSVS